MLETRFNLRGVLCSTHVSTPLLILNGPIVQALQVNSGHNVFGPGWRANATIGRAVQLALVNIGGAQPGVLDKATFGHPGKYTYCIAENEAASPWEPLHVERGFRADNTVTVYPAEAPHNINNHGSQNARDLLTVVADCGVHPAAITCTWVASVFSCSRRSMPPRLPLRGASRTYALIRRQRTHGLTDVPMPAWWPCNIPWPRWRPRR